MRQRTGPQASTAEKTIKDIRRATRKHQSLEEKIRIVLEGLRGEDSIAAICRREGIAESLYCSCRRNSSKRARSVLPVMPPARRPVTRRRRCAVKAVT